MKFIKRHITAIIVTIVCLILMILAAFAVYRMFYPSNEKSVCGDRGNGPEITDSVLSNIKDNEIVNSASYQLGLCETTIKFYIDVKDDVKIKDAQELGDIIIENLGASSIEFYDAAIYVTQKTGEMKEYPAIGQKAKGSKKINWDVNKEVSDSEE